MLARLYWYTAEFGLIATPAGIRTYGAGILSSAGELPYWIESREPNRIGFDLLRIMRTRYKIDTFQETYFVIRDFGQLFEAMRWISPRTTTCCAGSSRTRRARCSAPTARRIGARPLAHGVAGPNRAYGAPGTPFAGTLAYSRASAPCLLPAPKEQSPCPTSPRRKTRRNRC